MVAETPLGRVRSDWGRPIALMVFIDASPEVEMALRLLRDIERAIKLTAAEALRHLRGEPIALGELTGRRVGEGTGHE